MDITPILNHTYPPAWGPGVHRYQTIGSLYLQSGLNINPDVPIPAERDMVVSAILRRDGSFELELKTRLWEDGIGVFYSYDIVDDIFRILRGNVPLRFVRLFETGAPVTAIRGWINGVLNDARELEEQSRR